jgi:RNA polymerase sigma-70 factor (ECF subfamily)
MTAETIGPTLRNLLPRLWSFAFRLSGTSGLAEDLTDRTFVRLFRLSKTSETEQITLGLALREMYTVWRCDLEGAYFQAREHESPSYAGRLPSEGRLIDAILNLAGLERAVVLLAHLERLSVPEIAAITNEPIGQVLNAMSAAHVKIQQRINPEWKATRSPEDA